MIITMHPDWKGVPGTINDEYLPLWNGTNYVDKYVVFIYGNTKEGKRYCRAVELSGSMVRKEGQRRLEYVLETVARLGPSVCTELIDENAPLPREADQPPIQ